MALAHDMIGDSQGAIKWLEMLTSLVPNDPGVLCKLGAIYHRYSETLACLFLIFNLSKQSSVLEEYESIKMVPTLFLHTSGLPFKHCLTQICYVLCLMPVG
jgi:hypothetical protein